MTPLEVDIALWYYARPGDYGKGNGDNNFNAPAVQAALARFVDAGLLRRNVPNTDLPQEYTSTEGLRVYVDALCSVPWPEQKWVMPQPWQSTPDGYRSPLDRENDRRRSESLRILQRGLAVHDSLKRDWIIS
jgi:hypothetical protein